MSLKSGRRYIAVSIFCPSPNHNLAEIISRVSTSVCVVSAFLHSMQPPCQRFSAVLFQTVLSLLGVWEQVCQCVWSRPAVTAGWAADQIGLGGGHFSPLCLLIHDAGMTTSLTFFHTSFFFSLCHHNCYLSLFLSLAVSDGLSLFPSPVQISFRHSRAKEDLCCISVFENLSASLFCRLHLSLHPFSHCFLKPVHLPSHQHFSCIESTVWFLSNPVKSCPTKVSLQLLQRAQDAARSC